MFEFLKSLFFIISVITGLFFVFIVVYVLARLVALAFIRTIKEQLMIGKDEQHEEDQEEKTIH
jgi:hypothetical protein